MKLVAVISFGTSPEVLHSVLAAGNQLASYLGCEVWGDPYFHSLGVGTGLLGGALPADGRYVSNVRVFLSLARFVRANDVGEIVIVHAPQMTERVCMESKRILPRSLIVVLNTGNLTAAQCYRVDSDHPQTRTAEGWVHYEPKVLMIARICWLAYAWKAGLTWAELAEVRFGFGY